MAVSMDRWKGKVAVVTGSSAGIGAAIAQQLVEEGLQVVGLARRVERVEELARKLAGKTGKLHAYRTDMSKPDDVVAAFEWVTQNVGPVHILINNAGIAQNTTLINGDIDKWKELLDVNVMGLCVATREAVSSMKAEGIDGHIIHINSVLGHYVANIPGINVYPASKYAVTALTETLRNELAAIGSSIKITSISPGIVNTEIAKSRDDKMNEKTMADIFKNGLRTEDIADAVVYVLSTPPHVQIRELKLSPVSSPF